jgi:hypothetical protein
MSEPFLHPDINPIDLLVYRGRGLDVDTVLVGGEVLLRNRKLTRIDRDEVIRKLRESVAKGYGEDYREKNRLFAILRERVASYFYPWYKDIENIEKEPYYFMNNRY